MTNSFGEKSSCLTNAHGLSIIGCLTVSNGAIDVFARFSDSGFRWLPFPKFEQDNEHLLLLPSFFGFSA